MSLSILGLLVSTSPSMCSKPLSRATSMMLSIKRAPKPCPAMSSATTKANSQVVRSGLVT